MRHKGLLGPRVVRVIGLAFVLEKRLEICQPNEEYETAASIGAGNARDYEELQRICRLLGHSERESPGLRHALAWTHQSYSSLLSPMHFLALALESRSPRFRTQEPRPYRSTRFTSD